MKLPVSKNAIIVFPLFTGITGIFDLTPYLICRWEVLPKLITIETISDKKTTKDLFLRWYMNALSSCTLSNRCVTVPLKADETCFAECGVDGGADPPVVGQILSVHQDQIRAHLLSL
jgi:hypothetical protein